MRGAEKIQSDYCKWEQSIPLCQREIEINHAQYCNEVVFECENSTFCCIDLVLCWWDQLIVNLCLENVAFKSLDHSLSKMWCWI